MNFELTRVVRDKAVRERKAESRMNPPGRELWLAACISVGVHATAVFVAAQLGVGALRRTMANLGPPVLEVIVTEPLPVVTPPVPLPVAPATVTAVTKSVESKPPPASVAKPAAPTTPPPEPRLVSSAIPPKPAAPVASPPVVKVGNVVPPHAVVAPVVGPQPVTVAAARVPAVATAAPPNGLSANAAAGRVEEGPGTLSLPQYRTNPAPVYPESARRQRQEGVVWLAVEVSEQGDALAVKVGESSGHAALDEAAVAAVRNWKFEPARRGARPTAAKVEVPVRFQLQK